MKDTIDRINNIVGQLHGVEKMIEEGKGCEETLVQLKSIKSAVSSLINKYFELNFERCLYSSNTEDKETLKKLFSELNN